MEEVLLCLLMECMANGDFRNYNRRLVRKLASIQSASKELNGNDA